MRKKIQALVLSVLIIASLVLVGCAPEAAPPEAAPPEAAPEVEEEAPVEVPTPTPEVQLPSRILMGSAVSQTSSMYPMYAKWAELADRAMPNVSVTLILPGGCLANISALYDHEIDIGAIAPCPYYEAINGLGSKWGGDPQPNIIRCLFCTSHATKTFSVRADSDIWNVSDLKGKNVYFGYAGSSTREKGLNAFDALGMTAGVDYEEMVGSLQDGVTAFKDRRIDAYLKTVGGHNVDATHIDIMATTPIRFIGFTEEQAEKIKTKYPQVPIEHVPAGWYDALPEHEALILLSGFNTAGVRDDFPEELAYQCTKSIAENYDELVAVYGSCEVVDPLNSPNILAPGVYLHPGAIRYYREAGVEIPESVIPPEMK